MRCIMDDKSLVGEWIVFGLEFLRTFAQPKCINNAPNFIVCHPPPFDPTEIVYNETKFARFYQFNQILSIRSFFKIFLLGSCYQLKS